MLLRIGFRIFHNIETLLFYEFSARYEEFSLKNASDIIYNNYVTQIE